MPAGYRHSQMAAGRWWRMSLFEQLGNIGSEVSRARIWQSKGGTPFDGAVDRALELFDLTLADPRLRGRRKEIARARELFCDAVFNNAASYGSRLEDMQKYFDVYALAARRLTCRLPLAVIPAKAGTPSGPPFSRG